MSVPRVAIVYLSYHSDEYIDEAFSAVSNLNYSKENLALIVVDNLHPTHGSSLDKIQKVLEIHKNTLPKYIILPQNANLGFCGGNNVGIKWALDNNYDYVFLHNQDGSIDLDCISKMIQVMESNKKIGCAQALVMLDHSDRINSAGNSFNYIGFGYISNFGQKISEIKFNKVQNVGYASGAALLLRADLLRAHGGLNELFFVYHEDVEYSLRMKFLGYQTAMVSDAKYFHKYEFNRNNSKFYFIERNRYLVLLMYYKWPTLLLLLPLIIISEISIFIFFVLKGWVKLKLEFYKYFINHNNIKILLKNRSIIQNIRQIKDRNFIRGLDSGIQINKNQKFSLYLIKLIVNPILIIYYSIVRIIIFW